MNTSARRKLAPMRAVRTCISVWNPRTQLETTCAFSSAESATRSGFVEAEVVQIAVGSSMTAEIKVESNPSARR